MFAESRFRWKLLRIRHSNQKWVHKQRKEIEQAREARASRDELESLEQDYRMEQDLTDDAIAKLQTRHLLDEADRLSIPRPPFINNEHRIDSTEPSTYIEAKTSGFVLAPHTILELRDAIRKERKERSEIARLWLSTIAPIVAAITGLVGALIGLLAALHK